MKKQIQYVVYTDGACRGNPGPGGWGAIVIKQGTPREFSGFEPKSTNNRMELTAAIRGLQQIPNGSNVIVYTDSMYVKRGITEWINSWRSQGKLHEDSTTLKNPDLWLQLSEQTRLKTVEWRYVKGHSGNVHNERADYLAVGQIKRNCVREPV